MAGPRPRGVLFGLAKSDLLHEWILSLCLVLAVAAVLAPLLILFGLKYGTIATLRHRLIQDPRNREIRPMVSKAFSRDWFKEMETRGDVAFIIPYTRQISASLRVAKTGQGKKLDLDIIPTGPGDRLVLENGAPIPEPGQCVLTEPAAQALEAKPGDTISAEARRIKGSSYESGRLELTVAGVVSARASPLKALFVGLPLLEAVERYKDGRAVPEYGWPGSTPLAYPVFSGAVVLLDKPLDKAQEFRLINNTGFTRVQRLDPAGLAEAAGLEVAPDKAVYLVSSRQKQAGTESIKAVELRLRGEQAVVLPWVRGLEAEVVDGSGKTLGRLDLTPLSLDPDKVRELGLSPAPPWGDPEAQGKMGERRILLPPGPAIPADGLSLRVRAGERELVFPLESAAALEQGAERAKGRAFVPASLAGILNLFQERDLSFDPGSGGFLLERRGYSGFRLYAATIDQVEGLKRDLEKAGIGVHTEAQRIADVTELDAYLTLIFWLIALVGLGGGAASLVASLYASVERKRRDLSILRLIGLAGSVLFRFPVYQSLLIAAGGYALAASFFGALSWLINSLFKAHLQAGESLCRLSFAHLGLALGATLAVALAASLTAAWRTTRIDPAEALRDE